MRYPLLVAPLAFDAALEGYIEKLYDSGAHKVDVNYLIAAVTHLACWPRGEFGKRCPRAAAAALGWSRLEPDKSKEPCPWILATLLAQYLCQCQLPSALDAARCMILQYGFYLRPAEALNLRVVSCFGGEGRRGRYDRCAVVIAPSAEDDLELTALVQPPSSKTGTFDDTVILDEFLIDQRIKDVYLAALRAARAEKHELLLRGLTYRTYHRLVQVAAREVQLKFNVTPHMFRHGAASEDYFRKLRDLPCIQQRGRWLALSSVQRY